MTAVENEIPDVNSLVKKTNFNTKVTEIERKIPDVSSLVKKQTIMDRLIHGYQKDYLMKKLVLLVGLHVYL